MGKYDKRSASVRKNKLSKVKQEVEEKGLIFICVEFKDTNNYIYFIKNGEVCRQALGSFRRGNKLRKEYLDACWPIGAGLYKFYENEELVYKDVPKDEPTFIIQEPVFVEITGWK